MFKNAVAAMVACLALTVGINLASAQSPEKPEPKTHVTIYVEGEILAGGGAVWVVGRQVPEAEWRSLAGGDNPAERDPGNPKRLQVREGDRLFGAVASSPATVVEFFHPEGGSYTFNMRTLTGRPSAPAGQPGVRSARISVGSGGATDPETGRQIEWDSTSLIYVQGPRRDEGWARVMQSTFANAVHGGPPAFTVSKYLGVRVIALTPEGIAKYVRDTQP